MSKEGRPWAELVSFGWCWGRPFALTLAEAYGGQRRVLRMGGAGARFPTRPLSS